MRITINPTLDMETLEWLPRPSYEYSGPVMEFKKGRGQMEQNMKADAAEAAAARKREAEQYGITNKLEGEEIASTTPGSLSPASTAQLAADRDNIARTYNGMRQTAFRTMGMRGLGSAPSGFTQTATNAADLGEAQADTGAYRTAQERTEAQRQKVMDTSAGLTGQQGSIGTGASGQSTQAAVARNRAGSTFGDIMGGIGDVAGIAVPAIGLARSFAKMGSKGSSGVGDYGVSGGGSIA